MSHPMTTKRGLIPEDLMLFSLAEQMTLADDGRRLAYTVKRPQAPRNGYQADAYLMDVDARRAVKLTSGEGYASSPAWSRDGSKLALVWQGSDEARACSSSRPRGACSAATRSAAMRPANWTGRPTAAPSSARAGPRPTATATS